MPCPLRFVLAGVSAAVLATLFFMGRSDPALEKPKAAGDGGAGSRARQWLRLLLDFFTGKYLYDTWRKGSSGGSSSASPAGGGGCPFARLHGGSSGAADAKAAAAAGCPAHKHAAAATAAAGGGGGQGLHEE